MMLKSCEEAKHNIKVTDNDNGYLEECQDCSARAMLMGKLR